ncbi:conserved hypothetical protein [Marinobacter nauticus ATCC 49840]|nr:conserved hypothetical protein [Marinobacter nauticus ATCC 49840]
MFRVSLLRSSFTCHHLLLNKPTMHQTFSAHLLAENYSSKLNKTMATDRESEPAQKSKNKRIPISNHQSMMPRVRKPSLRFLWPWMAKAKRKWMCS